MKYLCILTIMLLKIPCILAMDNMPPKDIPAYERAQVDVRQHKRHSREHSTIDIHATLTDAQGKETKIEMVRDENLQKSNDSDEVKKTYSKNFVLGTNCVSVVCTSLIGAGVTLAVKYSNKNC